MTLRRCHDPPEADVMRQDLAAIIRAVMQAPTLAERQRLIAERDRLGKQLAHLLKAHAKTKQVY